MKRKILSLILAVALAATLVTGAAAVTAASFQDVQSGDWFYSYVDEAARKGYMTGVAATEFAPNAYLTRAMATVVLGRVAKAEVNNGVQTVFTDVPQNMWYTGAVAWANEKQIVLGYGNGLFGTGDLITRQDAATMIVRLLNFLKYQTDTTTKQSFTDQSAISEYALSAVAVCANAGLIEGYPDGSFGPKRQITRAEFSAIITRLDALLSQNGGSGGTGGSDGSGGTGGSGGGSVTAPVTSNYTVKASMKLTSGVFKGTGLDLVAGPYTVTVAADGTVTGDKTSAEILSDLISGANQTRFESLISSVQGLMKGQSFTIKMGEDAVKVSVSNTGVLSAVKTGPVDLGAYLKQASQQYRQDSVQNALVNDLEQRVGVSLTETQRAAARGVFATLDPALYYTDNQNGTLSLLDPSTCYSRIVACVQAYGQFTQAVGDNAVFYTQLFQAVSSDMNQLGGTMTVASQFAGMIADADGCLANQNGSTLLQITDRVTAEDYTYLANHLNTLIGGTTMLPTQLPSLVLLVLQSYDVSIALEKSN